LAVVRVWAASGLSLQGLLIVGDVAFRHLAFLEAGDRHGAAALGRQGALAFHARLGSHCLF